MFLEKQRRTYKKPKASFSVSKTILSRKVRRVIRFITK